MSLSEYLALFAVGESPSYSVLNRKAVLWRKRSWRERLFSRPWQPARAWDKVAEGVTANLTVQNDGMSYRIELVTGES